MNLNLIEKISKHRKDPKFKNLFEYIHLLTLQNFDEFQEAHINFFKELNSLFEINLIDQEIYDEYTHDIGGEVTLYLKEREAKELLYFCIGCEKYFLEKKENSFKTELKTSLNLEYATKMICSLNCSKTSNLKKIVANPGQIINEFFKE